MGRRRKNDISGLGIVFLVIIGFIIFIIQKSGWWLLAIAIIAVIIYLLYRYLKKSTPPPYAGDTSTEPEQVAYSNESSYSSPYRKTENAAWVSANTEVEIHGYAIKGGMFYLSEFLQAISGSSPDPCLIDPSLRINKASPDTAGSSMSYWPSYSNISPAARAAYLDWLSSGRDNSATNVGYVFLFFYGLERRVLFDSQRDNTVKAEIPQIAAEVQRLLQIYGSSSGSFNSYASSFLNFLCSQFRGDGLERFARTESAQYGDLPFTLRMEAGKLSSQSKPIPPWLAFEWFMRSPDIRLRTPAKRCNEEFSKLFMARYASKYGNGLVIKPNKTSLRCEYHPASSSFSGRTFSNSLEDVPDVTKLTRPISVFQAIADECMEDLDAFSRFLGRKPEEQELKIFALAQLPSELLRESKYVEIQKFISFLKEKIGSNPEQVLDISTILSALGLDSSKALSNGESLLVAQLLGRLGYGIEPDIRFGGSKLVPTEKAVIFTLADNLASAASPEYTFAALLLSFSSIVIHADGSVSPKEAEKMRAHVSSILSLTQNEQKRLDALLLYYCSIPASLTQAKKRIQELKPESKSFILSFLLSVANADGNIDPAEIKILKKIYELFGVDGNNLYSDFHAFQTRRDAPISISAESPAAGFSIPKKPSKIAKASPVSLDMDLVNRTIQETHQVQSLLTDIFSDGTEDKSNVPALKPSNAQLIANLDSSHSELFRKISDKDSIPVDSFNDICKSLGILPSGAIEMINTAFFDKAEELYIEEDGEMLILNNEVAKEMFK